MIGRLLVCMDGGDPSAERSRLRGFRLVLALVIATEYVAKGLRDRASMEPLDWLQVALAVGLAVSVFVARRTAVERAAFAGFAVLQAWWIVQYFPSTGNHRYLEAWFSWLLATLDESRADERTLVLRALRWSTVVVLVVSGLQKLVHGYWFRGQFLAWSLWRDPFRVALAPLFPPDELARLLDLGAAAGDGPYIVRSGPVLLLSNLVWLGQIVLGVALVPRATRAAGWVTALALVVLTELVARELMFGIEFAAALMLFARGDAVRRFVPLAAALAAWVLAVRLGWLPEVLLH